MVISRLYFHYDVGTLMAVFTRLTYPYLIICLAYSHLCKAMYTHLRITQQEFFLHFFSCSLSQQNLFIYFSCYNPGTCIRIIKTYISNWVRTALFWNNSSLGTKLRDWKKGVPYTTGR